jgi:WD40 repeat protein
VSREGHLSPVTSIAVCSTTAAVITAGYDGHVLRWDAALKRPVWSTRFPDLVNSVAVSPDGTSVAVACADGYAYILDTVSGFERHRLGQHADDVNDVVWHPSGRELAVVCDAGETDVSIWVVSENKLIRTLIKGHEHGVFSIAYSPDGLRLASASEDGTVRVWRSGIEEGSLPHAGDVETVAWASDNSYIATGCDDGVLRLWDTATLALKHELQRSSASVRRVAFSPDGSRVLAGCYDGVLRIYDTQSTDLLDSIQGDLQWERAATFDGRNSVVVGTFGSTPRRVAINGAKTSLDATPPTWGVNAIYANQSGVYFATDCGYLGTLAQKEMAFVAPTLICGISGTDRETVLLASDYLGRIHVLEGSTVRSTWATGGGPANTVVALPDRTVVVGSYDGSITRWAADGTLIDRVQAHHGPVKKVVWSDALQALIVGSSDNTVSVWSTDLQPEPEGRLKLDSLVLVNDLHPLQQTPAVALASRDRAVRVWWPTTGRVETLPVVHSKSIKAITGTDDDSVLITGSYDGSLCFWNIDGNVQLVGYRQVVHHGKPGVPAVVTRGSQVYSAGWNGTIAEWDRTGSLVSVYDPRRWQR